MVFRGTAEISKTVLCTRFMSPEGCRFGDRCNFAHGEVELRPRPPRNNNREDGGGRGGERSSNPNAGGNYRNAAEGGQGNFQGGGRGNGQFQGQGREGWAREGGGDRQGGRGEPWGRNQQGNGQYQGGMGYQGYPANSGMGAPYGVQQGGYGPSGPAGPRTYAGQAGADRGNGNPLANAQQPVPEHGWTQHTAPEGYAYYYNSKSGVSQWERPADMDYPMH